jgi:hypothetical protein
MAKEIAALESLPKNPIVRYFKAMPIIFPLITFFLIGQGIFEAFNYWGEEVGNNWYHGRAIVWFLYALFWIAVCFRQKWGAFAFIVLTILNVALHLFVPDHFMFKRALGDLLFIPLPINILFSFLILFYFRRLQ